ncbi:MAG: metal ABC transporter ATP-binding protein [Candidatus Cyclonatronum sp.]|uniref:metal ABC transporter ATP-binding protein n=1 Tax=Cyclonatronum sp. TaxID=3024185 RepID=UPI0025B83F7F|nr:metal ABC transporter ATP-binding protein [Cyclonatronum sp.]MCC5933529.1 metal ABC transporter ATP-binding protein [Balneolales bacterium]MCH8486527.1 metal ABC transporter ATP-binding protein [Cyclonatronum sp.]
MTHASKTGASAPPVEVHDLTVSYQNKPVLWDVDFTLPEGTLTAIVGPNGAGKSTLIKVIMGLIEPVSGHALIYGKPLQQMRKRIAYVPQRESVDWNFPVSVLDVVLMGRYAHLKMFRRPGRRDRELALQALEKVGMAAYSDRQIAQLSGGQQQRVFLARALAQDADIYFMDEPFAGVDASTEEHILQLLRELRSAGRTVIVVHHDLQTVSDYFDWVLMLNLRLVAIGPMETTFTKENLQKAYGGRLNILTQVIELSRRENFVRETEHD